MNGAEVLAAHKDVPIKATIEHLRDGASYRCVSTRARVCMCSCGAWAKRLTEERTKGRPEDIWGKGPGEIMAGHHISWLVLCPQLSLEHIGNDDVVVASSA